MEVIIAKNCVKIEVINIDDVELGTGAYDDRHDVYSHDNTDDLKMYLNYMQLVNEIAQSNPRSRYTYMLDLGYFPIVMPPLFLGEKMHEIIIPALDKACIPYQTLQASSFTKLSYSFIRPDIWVSKIDVSKNTGIIPYNVNLKNTLEAIL